MVLLVIESLIHRVITIYKDVNVTAYKLNENKNVLKHKGHVFQMILLLYLINDNALLRKWVFPFENLRRLLICFK